MKKEFYKKSLKFDADFKSTSCTNILSNLYSLVYILSDNYTWLSEYKYLVLAIFVNYKYL